MESGVRERTRERRETRDEAVGNSGDRIMESRAKKDGCPEAEVSKEVKWCCNRVASYIVITV